MADITITAANVVPGIGAVIDRRYNFGETITAGMGVYLKASDNQWYKAQSDGTAVEAGSSGNPFGIAVCGGSAGQPGAVQTAGQITIGATVAAGVLYYVSAAAGGICPVADLVSTRYVTSIGYGITTGIMVVNPVITGVALA